jgi:hypothetical protein
VTNARGAVLSAMPSAMTSPVNKFSVDPMPMTTPSTSKSTSMPTNRPIEISLPVETSPTGCSACSFAV